MLISNVSLSEHDAQLELFLEGIPGKIHGSVEPVGASV